jgi:predicted ribosome quality control (RQC) complex YloA/Tae2 family protein
MIDSYYANVQEQVIRKALRLKLKHITNPRHKRLKNSAQKLNLQIQKKDNASKYKKFADLIMSNLYNNQDFIKKIKVLDWETNEEIIIPLDKEITLKENAQKYYALYSKSKDSREKLIQLKNETEEQLNYIEQIQYSIDNADTIDILFEILNECEEYGLTQQKTPTKKEHIMNLDFVELDGFKAYIGKNNKQNDYIISKLSSAEDYWFHTQNCAGSHILLKITDNKEPNNQVLYECCKLAKKYSTASKSTKVGVIYTKRKHIKKPPKANLGYVIYKNETEIIVNDNLE